MAVLLDDIEQMTKKHLEFAAKKSAHLVVGCLYWNIRENGFSAYTTAGASKVWKQYIPALFLGIEYASKQYVEFRLLVETNVIIVSIHYSELYLIQNVIDL